MSAKPIYSPKNNLAGHFPQKAPDIACRRCGGTNFAKDGKNLNDIQLYRCKDCRRRHHHSSSNTKPKKLVDVHNKPDLPCQHCGSERYYKDGKNRRGIQLYRCKDCGRCCNTIVGQTNDVFAAPEAPCASVQEVSCTHCGGENFNKRGKDYKGDQIYFCKTCERFFTHNPRKLGKEKKKPFLFCRHCKSPRFVKRRKDYKGDQIYLCKECGKHFVDNPRKVEVYEVDPEKEYLKDVWDARRLGISVGKSRYSYKLNFSSISQKWLKDSAKFHLKLSLSTLSFSTAESRLNTIRKLSTFLEDSYPNIKPQDIDREVVVNFLANVRNKNGKKLSASTQCETASCLRIFFDLANQNGWLDFQRHLIRSEDFPKIPKHKPRYIPEQVVAQLNEHLDELYEPIMRMVLVIQECGMRVSELLYLDFDCLLQDKDGDWFLRYHQFKMKKDITIPISRELARVIQEQQIYIRNELSEEYKYLFCANSSNGGLSRGFYPQPRPMAKTSFNNYLKKLAKNNDIRTESGEFWDFQSHQFRHTVGTRMVNNKVPHHIIQRYLGHESPEMTSRYAHIHDQTLKEAMADFRGRVVNIAGQVVESNNIEADDPELQWVKRSVQAQALPNGTCALPVISKGCPHANACLTCTHFRTSPEHLETHKKERDTTIQVIEKAKANDWTRIQEMNEKKLKSLNNIISGLEGGEEDGCQA